MMLLILVFSLAVILSSTDVIAVKSIVIGISLLRRLLHILKKCESLLNDVVRTSDF